MKNIIALLIALMSVITVEAQTQQHSIIIDAESMLTYISITKGTKSVMLLVPILISLYTTPNERSDARAPYDLVF